MEEPRNLVEKIVEQFVLLNRSKNIVATQEDWGIECEEGTFQIVGRKCCGLAVMMIGESCNIDGRHIDQPDDAAHFILGLNELYVSGFIQAFDGAEYSEALTRTNDARKKINKEHVDTEEEAVWAQGFRDGALTWKTLVEKDLVYRNDEDNEYYED